MTHFARSITVDELIIALDERIKQKLINVRTENNLRMYTYTNHCVYERAWDDYTKVARGLIIDIENKKILASPFPKFFNMGEINEPIPETDFDILEKVDGSLIIIFHDGNEWRGVTKGSFNSQQAIKATSLLKNSDLSSLVIGNTYLAEYVSPENRIVVAYSNEELILLGAYYENGEEFTYEALSELAISLNCNIAKKYTFNSLADLVDNASTLPSSQEGYVLRFSNGYRLKIKGNEYKRIHALIANCTPLAIWRSMEAGDDLDRIKKDIPEEFWVDFDTIKAKLTDNLNDILTRVKEFVNLMADWSDKEVGLNLVNIDISLRSLIFPYRKSNGNPLDGKTKGIFYKMIRPDANRLDGYTPSYSMNQILEDF